MATKLTKYMMKKIIAIAISSKDNTVYSWYYDEVDDKLYIMEGTSTFLNKSTREFKNVIYPDDHPPNDPDKGIVAIGIDQNDRCYTWYKDYKVSCGSPTNLGSKDDLEDYALPAGQNPSKIVGMAISTEGKCYAWYDNNTVSCGNYNWLDRDKIPYSYKIVGSEKTPSDIIDIGISKKNRTYIWFKDGVRSSGITKTLNTEKSKNFFIKTLLPKDDIKTIIETAFEGKFTNDYSFIIADEIYHCPTQTDITS